MVKFVLNFISCPGGSYALEGWWDGGIIQNKRPLDRNLIGNLLTIFLSLLVATQWFVQHATITMAYFIRSLIYLFKYLLLQRLQLLPSNCKRI